MSVYLSIRPQALYNFCIYINFQCGGSESQLMYPPVGSSQSYMSLCLYGRPRQFLATVHTACNCARYAKPAYDFLPQTEVCRTPVGSSRAYMSFVLSICLVVSGNFGIWIRIYEWIQIRCIIFIPQWVPVELICPSIRLSVWSSAGLFGIE